LTQQKIINILGKKYTLKFYKNLLEYKNENGLVEEFAFGDCNHISKLIRICNTVSKEETADTLFHEILHAIDDELNLKIPHNKLHNISTVLTDTLLRNKLIKIKI